MPDQRAVIQVESCAKPAYPQADLRDGHTGTVVMQFLVKEDGNVAESRLARSSGYRTLDQEALGALGKCRFAPAKKNGLAVSAWTEIQYVWTGA